MSEVRRRPTQAVWRVGLALIAGALVLTSSGGAGRASGQAGAATQSSDSCTLHSSGGHIKHVIVITFDNVHFSRDNPAVPSDLEQMPNLLNFITGGGTLISHQHTPLIAHTGTNILSVLTGLYGDKMGQPVTNAFGFYDTDRAASFRSSFAYWTSRLGGTNDNTFSMTTDGGRNTPAPWVPFTRAGCSFGAVAMANTVLENTRFDIPAVFGPSSPEAQEERDAASIPCGVGSNPPCTPDQQKAKNRPQTDFVGIAVHCGRNDRACSAAKGARPDALPDEPGGYAGFSGLFGARYAGAFISPNGPVTDLDGQAIADRTGNPGFPGFGGMTANTSLGIVAAMQERGIPVTYAYISDAHDDRQTDRAFGPGQAGYVQALERYDRAFGQFFSRLNRNGMTPANTLFVFTADEGDRFVGGPPSPAGCDGVHVSCTYQQIGELDASLSGLLSTVPPYSTGTPVPSLSVHGDSAPTVYLDGNPRQTDIVTRTVERAAAHIEAVNPITHDTDQVSKFLAGTAAMRNLHMLTSDPRRNPTLTLFAHPDYYLCAAGFQCPFTGSQVVQNPAFAWNHGGIAPEINTTWLGLVGPGVRHMGVNDAVWSSHTDTRPTILGLLGLTDDYRHQGRVLVEVLDRGALPRSIDDPDAYLRLAQVYEQLNSPVGQFGRATLVASTAALESGTAADESVFTAVTRQLEELGQRRDALVEEMAQILDRPVSAAGPKRNRGDAGRLGDRGLDLLRQAWLLAGQ